MNYYDDLRDLRESMAKLRRAQMRVVGTREEESARKIVEAAARGAPRHVAPALFPGSIVLVDGALYFHSEAERDAFAKTLKAAPP